MMLCFFFFNDTATTEIYTLSLHDALPILNDPRGEAHGKIEPARTVPQIGFGRRYARCAAGVGAADGSSAASVDRKSTRLNSSHLVISYAVFCLKKKKSYTQQQNPSNRVTC